MDLNEYILKEKETMANIYSIFKSTDNLQLESSECIHDIGLHVSKIAQNSKPLISLVKDMDKCKQNVDMSIIALEEFIQETLLASQYKDITRSTTISKNPKLYTETVVNAYKLKKKFDNEYLYYKDSFAISKILVYFCSERITFK